jgi:hypothetical protein
MPGQRAWWEIMQSSRRVQHVDARAPAATAAAALAIEVAARHARNRGVEVRVVLPRAPGVVATVRDAAATMGVAVSTTITGGSVTARFGARTEGSEVRVAEATGS